MEELIMLIEEYLKDNNLSKRQFCLNNGLNYTNFCNFMNNQTFITEPFMRKVCDVIKYPYNDIWFEKKFAPILKEVIKTDDTFIDKIISILKEEINEGRNESEDSEKLAKA